MKKLSGCCFLIKFLIRYLIAWKTLRFTALTQILPSKVEGPALPKERCEKGLCVFFSLQKVGAHNSEPSTQLDSAVCGPLMRYPLEELSRCCFLGKI